jgi:hypothetical protein
MTYRSARWCFLKCPAVGRARTRNGAGPDVPILRAITAIAGRSAVAAPLVIDRLALEEVWQTVDGVLDDAVRCSEGRGAREEGKGGDECGELPGELVVS